MSTTLRVSVEVMDGWMMRFRVGSVVYTTGSPPRHGGG